MAGAHPCKDSQALFTYALTQCFEVVFEKPEIKRAKLTVEGRVIGLLRSHCKGGGSAQEGPGQAVVNCGPVVLAWREAFPALTPWRGARAWESASN